MVADLVVVKRVDSSSDVAVTGRIGIEGVVSGSRIEATVRVRLKGTPTRSGVSGAGGVGSERKGAIGRVVGAGCVAESALKNRWPCCRLPVVLLTSAL